MMLAITYQLREICVYYLLRAFWYSITFLLRPLLP